MNLMMNEENVNLFIQDEAGTLALGGKLAETPLIPALFFYGQLGAGKTTFVRGFLRSLGL